MLKIKFPSEFPRAQRSIEDLRIFKANEFRNLVFYSLVYILEPYLDTSYFDHFLLYIMFIRILTQDAISLSDIDFSRILIHKFLEDFEDLYSEEHLSFNLHAHQHLPDQVMLFGPLNKLSCFSFEGVFKMCKGLFNGTRNISNQIATNLNISSYMYFNANDLGKDISNAKLRNFLNSNSKIKSKDKNGYNSLLQPILNLSTSEIPKEHLFLIQQQKPCLKSCRASSQATIESFRNIIVFF